MKIKIDLFKIVVSVNSSNTDTDIDNTFDDEQKD